MGFTEEAKKTYLSAAGWFPGEDEKLEDIIEKRSNCIRHTTPADKELHLGRIFDLEGKLHLDLAFQGRAILGGTKLTFKLSRAPAEFFLMSKNANIVPKIDFLELTLNITRTRINREVVIAHEKALDISPTKYPLTRTDVKTSTINSGTLSATIDNVITGQLPRRCFICFVSNEAYNGLYTKNPFYFEHFNINHLSCYLDGEQFPRK